MANAVLEFIDDNFWNIVWTLITWLVGLAFVRYNKRLFTRVNDELASVDVEDRSIKAIDQMVDLFTILIIVFITLFIWGVDEMIYAALTTIGVVGVMLGFAVKDIASNFISGIMLILSKDILVGDEIEVKGIEGKVEKITVRTTSIRKHNGALVLVPNSLLINNPVVDYAATDKRRLEVSLSLPSDTEIETVTDALRGVMEGDPRLKSEEPVEVLIRGFDTSKVNLELRLWVDNEDLTSV
ncbi:MAG: mechanosensitive ion channel, partial [Thermoplasmata archaeon]